MITQINDQPSKELQPLRFVQKMGGYWYVDRRFPFIHFEKEYLIIGNETKLYRWEVSKRENCGE